MAGLRPWLRTWWLPVLLGAGQLVLWPGGFWPEGVVADTGPIDPVQAAIGVVVTLVTAGALGWRYRAPVGTLAVVVGALVVGVLYTPVDALSVISAADVVALFSVAVWRPGRVTAVAVGLVAVVQGAVFVRVSPEEALPGVPVITVLYVLTAMLGRTRRKWREARAAAAERLARAEADRRRAAGAERDRLARELHDVTAHHLTAIVVHAAAARRLAANRPELVGQALDFAADTGRRTLAALHRLVAVIDPATADEPLALRLGRLVTVAEQAGQVLRVDATGVPSGGLPPAIDDAVYAVVREAATNAMRYAPGAPVTATVSAVPDEVRVDVRNAAILGVDRAGAGAGSLGAGLGLVGLRARVEELGGEFRSGPGSGGGWQVVATVPVPAVPEPVVVAEAPPDDGAGWPWWRRFGSDERVLDAAITVAVLLVPVLTLLANGDDDPAVRELARPRLAVLVGLLVLLHGAPVWWRRRAPWRILFAVLAAAVGYVAVVLVTPLGEAAMGPLYAGLGAEIVAVYTVAAYARPVWATWAAPVAAGCVGALTLMLVAVREAPDQARDTVGVLVWAVVFVAVPWSVGYLPPWLLGALLRRRRRRTLAAEAAALATAAREAATAAHAQRMRFAAGLHASVLDPARRLVRAADAGRSALGAGPAAAAEAVDQVIAEARAGLAAMRELLGALQPEDHAAGSAPPRGTADLAELCAERRADGREVTLDAGAPPHPLPVAVDLSGYRIVDAALDTADADPAGVILAYADEHLHVTVTGVPSATHGVVAARIRARVAAVGGGVEFDPAGTVAVRLPAAREEVPASLSE